MRNTSNTCGNCAYFVPASDPKQADKGMGNCCFAPPIVQFIPMEFVASGPSSVPLPQGKQSRIATPEPAATVMQMVPASARPQVLAGAFCHNHDKKEVQTH